MSTITLPQQQPGTSVSSQEFVQGLSPSEKQALFLTLLRDAMQFSSDSDLLPIEDEHGNPLGYYVPAKAAARRAESVLPKLTPQREAELTRRQTEVDRMIPEAEFRSWLKTADPARSQ